MCLCFLDLLQNLPDKSAESRSQPGDNNEISSRVYINFDGHKQSHKEIIISEKEKTKQTATYNVGSSLSLLVSLYESLS